MVDVINTLSQHKLLQTLKLHLSCKWQNKHIGDRTLIALTGALLQTKFIQHIDLNLQNWGFINGTQNLTHVGVLNFWLEISNLHFLKSIRVKLNLRMHPDEWRE